MTSKSLAEQTRDYVKERDQALTNLDIEWARKRLHAGSDEDDDFVILMAMHKARYESINIEDGLRHESAAWLRERGLKRMGGGDLLPDGNLPA